jgi:hypothetical protein
VTSAFDYTAKVDALLRKAERAGSEHEAEAFQEKAMQLIAKHGIDQAMLDARRQNEGGKAEDVVVKNVTIINPYSEIKARMVAWTVMNMRCRAILRPDPTGRSTGSVTVIGLESDVERAIQLVSSLLLQLTALVGKQRDPWDYTPARTYRKNWASGFAVSVSNRVRDYEAQAQKAAESDSDGPSTALVLVDRKAAVDKFYNNEFGNLGRAKTVKLGGHGYGQGVADGKNADINFNNRVGGSRNAIAG